MKKREIIARFMLVLFLVLAVFGLVYFAGDGSITGFSVFIHDDSGDFGSGTYNNTEWNGSGVMLTYWNSTMLDLPDSKASDWIDMSGNVLLLHMDNNWDDDSGEGNDGSSGGTGFSSDAIFGYSGEFDGSDYVGVGDDSSLSSGFETGFSIAAWVNVSSFEEGDWNNTIVSKWDVDSDSRSYHLNLNGSKVRFHISDDGFAGLTQSDVTIGSDRDSYMKQDASTTNYGSETYMEVKMYGTSWNERGIVSFDLSGIPNSSTIISADLKLYLSANSGHDQTIEVYKIDQSPSRDWSEGEVTWSDYESGSPWTSGGGDLESSATDSVALGAFDNNEWVSWNVTEDCRDFVNNSATNFGWVLKSASETSGGGQYKQFNTKEYTDSNYRPQLEITYAFPSETSGDVVESSNSLDLNSWVHVVAVYNGTDNEMSLYVNGEKDSNTGSASDVYSGSASDFYVGAMPKNVATYFFNGLIDELAVWNRALSSEEIGLIYEKQSSGFGYGGGENGEYISEVFDAGSEATWNSLNYFSDLQELVNFYAVDGSGAVFSADDITSWSKVNSDYGGGSGTDDMAYDKYGNLYILFNHDIYKSDDLGVTWSLVNDDFNPSDNNDGFVIDSDSSGNLYVIDGSGTVWKTSDGGSSFFSVGHFNWGKSNNPNGIAVNSSDAIFVVDGSGAVWVSVNSGVSWSEVNDSYGSTLADDMTVDSSGNLYILTNRDIYKSIDNGVIWIKINDSFNFNQDGLTMEADLNDNLYAIDSSGDIYKSTDGGFIWSESVGDFNGGATNDIKGFSPMARYTDLIFYVRSCDDSACLGESWVEVSNFSNLNLANNTYFQYKVKFETASTDITPILESVNVDYDLLNSNPVLSVVSPQDGVAFGYNESLALDFAVSDVDSNLDICWYTLNGGSEVIIPGCSNTTIDVPEGLNDLVVFANDTLGAEVNDSVGFTVQVGAPSILIDSPINDYFDSGNNVVFSYIPTDIDLEACELWGDFGNGFEYNQTDLSPTSGILNLFSLNLSDGDFVWDIRCNDSLGNVAFSGNKSFVIDSVNPSVEIFEPTGTKASRSNISLAFDISDSHIDTCWYNIYRGASEEVSNTSVDCAGSDLFDVTVDADFVLNLYANDSAGNFNMDTSGFSVDTSSSIVSPVVNDGGSGGGGGGGGAVGGSAVSCINVEMDSLEAIMYHGEEKSFELSVKNNGYRTINKCKLKVGENYRSWFSSETISNIAAGEIVEFLFSLTLKGKNVPKIYLECLEGNSSIPLNIFVVNASLDAEFKEINLQDDNNILIKYSVKSESSSEYTFVFDIYSEGEKVAEKSQDISLVSGENYDGEVMIELENVSSGLLKVSMTNLGDNEPLIENSIMYDSNLITGYISRDFLNSTTSYIVIIVLIFLVIATLMIRRIIKLHRK